MNGIQPAPGSAIQLSYAEVMAYFGKGLTAGKEAYCRELPGQWALAQHQPGHYHLVRYLGTRDWSEVWEVSDKVADFEVLEK